MKARISIFKDMEDVDNKLFEILNNYLLLF